MSSIGVPAEAQIGRRGRGDWIVAESKLVEIWLRVAKNRDQRPR